MLKVEHITKKFSGVVVLRDVSMEFEAGKVTALVGENGAGKSTLMKILSGVYTDFEGTISYKGEEIRFSNPKEAEDKGIAIIHQELNLVPYLSIRENIFLGREIINKWGLLNEQAMRNKTRQILESLKLNIDPDTPVYKLKVGQQQVVEIAKALMLESDVIIMDEPTSAISDHEVEVLFTLIDDLKKSNKAIIYISHKLDELFRIAERYVVLRDGAFVDAGEMKQINQEHLIAKMVGRRIKDVKKNAAREYSEEILSVRNLHLKNPIKQNDYLLKDISFDVKKGEVVGIFGLMGAGRTELFEAIFGLHPGAISGQIKIGPQEVNLKSPKDAIQAGIALVPEDRKKDGLILGLDVKSNISITTLTKLERFGLLDSKSEKNLASKYLKDLNIKTHSLKQLTANLSGGNQQKVVLAKWLATHPQILLLDEPTRGIDVNAKNEIYKLILDLATSGLGILVVSSELPEILAISDRILVMSEGNMTAEYTIDNATQDNILAAAIPKSI